MRQMGQPELVMWEKTNFLYATFFNIQEHIITQNNS